MPNPNNQIAPGNDKFDFVGTPGGPDDTLGDLTRYAILELDFDQGGHASEQNNPRTGLPNIFPDQQGNLFDTIDFLLDQPLFDDYPG